MMKSLNIVFLSMMLVVMLLFALASATVGSFWYGLGYVCLSAVYFVLLQKTLLGGKKE